MTQLDPNTEDARLQADPELQVSEGRAKPAQIVLTAIGALAIIVLVLYGLNHQRDETERTTASAPATETTGAAPPAGAQDVKKQDQAQQAAQGNQPKAAQTSNQGDQANKPEGRAETAQGAGKAGARNTTGTAPSPPAGAPDNAQSTTGGTRPK